MSTKTPSQAKNTITRCLAGLLHKPLSAKDKQLVRDEFPCCAYCEGKIEKRKGHFDHIIPIAEGGTNSIGNFVIACNICNGDDKREKHWEQFLNELEIKHNIYPDVIEKRKTKIRAWIAKHNNQAITFDEALKKLVTKEEQRVFGVLDEAIRRIKASVAEQKGS